MSKYNITASFSEGLFGELQQNMPKLPNQSCDQSNCRSLRGANYGLLQIANGAVVGPVWPKLTGQLSLFSTAKSLTLQPAFCSSEPTSSRLWGTERVTNCLTADITRQKKASASTSTGWQMNLLSPADTVGGATRGGSTKNLVHDTEHYCFTLESGITIDNLISNTTPRQWRRSYSLR